MTHVHYTASFLRQCKKLPADLQEEVESSIEVFRRDPHDRALKLHKLKGKLRGYFSFSVNYKYRIVCEKDTPDTWALLAVDDHDEYR